MKTILIQLGKTVLMLVACIIQFVALVLKSIEWVFGKAGELLNNVSIGVAAKVKGEKENSEEVTA